MSAHCCAHGHHDTPDDREPEGFRRVLWAALCINATLFLIEIAAGLAAGSASLQADALDFLGDTGNYAISLFVIGKALRYRSLAALAKGGTMSARRQLRVFRPAAGLPQRRQQYALRMAVLTE